VTRGFAALPSVLLRSKLSGKATGEEPLKCLYVASEVTGFAKTGGLADVAAALPAALAQLGVDTAVMMPLYGFLRTGPVPLEATPHRFEVPMGDRPVAGRIWRGRLPDSTVPIYFIEQPDYFDRVDPAVGRGLYQQKTPQGVRDYSDNCARYGFFSRAVLEALPRLGFWPEILHLNDWQTGLAPVYLHEFYRKHPRGELRRNYERIRTVFTVHNLAYQGKFWHLDMPLLGLPWRLYNPEALEFYGNICFLKGGLLWSDLLTTVSPTYAREIQTPYFGCGLQGVLTRRSDRLVGIVNGVDYRAWGPATDPHIAAPYDVETLASAKPVCKAALQETFGLDVAPRTPLFGMVSRLADQKGVDLLARVAPDLLAQERVQLVVLGQGEGRYHDRLRELCGRFPRQVGVRFELSEPLAHQIEAGADAFLMPSLYEPCGLNQLYSLRYGTIPVVRATGGLADTVVDATNATLAAGLATGFAFHPYNPGAFREAIDRCLRIYRDRPEAWRRMQQTAMQQDWSWGRSALEYQRRYRALVEAL
jgi:starch synthase